VELPRDPIAAQGQLTPRFLSASAACRPGEHGSEISLRADAVPWAENLARSSRG